MKRTNSFILFGRAFKNAKKDFWVSIQVLFWITLGLAAVFYVVEHMAQPEEYSNPWDAFVWAITRYIGDPGHFAGKGPVTLTGRYIDTIIGILRFSYLQFLLDLFPMASEKQWRKISGKFILKSAVSALESPFVVFLTSLLTIECLREIFQS